MKLCCRCATALDFFLKLSHASHFQSIKGRSNWNWLLKEFRVEIAFLYFQLQPQNFIRRCLVYRKEERADVLTLCEDSYLKPPINRKNSSLQNANSQTWRNMNFLSRKKTMTSLQCQLAAQTQESRPVETNGLWWQFTLWKNNVFDVEWPQDWTTLLQARDTLKSLSLLVFQNLEGFEEHIGTRGVRNLKEAGAGQNTEKTSFLGSLTPFMLPRVGREVQIGVWQKLSLNYLVAEPKKRPYNMIGGSLFFSNSTTSAVYLNAWCYFGLQLIKPVVGQSLCQHKVHSRWHLVVGTGRSKYNHAISSSRLDQP